MKISPIGRVNFPSVFDGASKADVRAGAWHRIHDVRRQQGVKLQAIACKTGEKVQHLEREESSETDLPLSRLYWWQRVLDVPVCDLLVDMDSPLSPPVMERARMVRVMRTVAAIRDKAESPSIRRLTETLVGQILEIMPELKDVGSWRSVGERRSQNDQGRTAERIISMSDLLEH